MKIINHLIKLKTATTLDFIDITDKIKAKLKKAGIKRGVINIQYVLHDDNIYVLEVNPRSSRTVPFLSKITGIPMINIATRIIMGKTLKEMGYSSGLYPESNVVGVKAPVFSFAKLLQVDISLGPEMKSTGEVMGVDRDFKVALFKALVGAGSMFSRKGTILATIADRDKQEAIPILKKLSEMGYGLCATAGTAAALGEAGLEVKPARKVHVGSPHIVDLIRANKISLVINTLTKGKAPESDGFQIRRAAVEYGVPCLTSLDTARAIMDVLAENRDRVDYRLVPLQEYLG